MATAIDTLMEKVMKSPHDMRAHFNLGRKLRKAKRDDEAEQAFRAALALKHDWSEVRRPKPKRQNTKPNTTAAAARTTVLTREHGRPPPQTHAPQPPPREQGQWNYCPPPPARLTRGRAAAAARSLRVRACVCIFGQAHANLGDVLSHKRQHEDAIVEYSAAPWVFGQLLVVVRALNPDVNTSSLLARYRLALAQRKKFGFPKASANLELNLRQYARAPPEVVPRHRRRARRGPTAPGAAVTPITRSRLLVVTPTPDAP